VTSYVPSLTGGSAVVYYRGCPIVLGLYCGATCSATRYCIEGPLTSRRSPRVGTEKEILNDQQIKKPTQVHVFS